MWMKSYTDVPIVQSYIDVKYYKVNSLESKYKECLSKIL